MQRRYRFLFLRVDGLKTSRQLILRRQLHKLPEHIGKFLLTHSTVVNRCGPTRKHRHPSGHTAHPKSLCGLRKFRDIYRCQQQIPRGGINQFLHRIDHLYRRRRVLSIERKNNSTPAGFLHIFLEILGCVHLNTPCRGALGSSMRVSVTRLRRHTSRCR